MPKKARPGSSKGRPGSSKGAKAKKAELEAAARQAEQEELRQAREAAEQALEEGGRAAQGQEWERAIGLFERGLATEAADDEATTAALRLGLEEATAAMATRDEARAAAARHHADGVAAMGGRDYVGAIAAFRRSLLLDDGGAQPAGDRAVIASLRGRLALQSEELSKTLLSALAEANRALDAQNEAREQAAALAATAEELMAELEPRRKLAVSTYERALSLDVNDAERTSIYQTRVVAIREALEADRATARSQLTEGHRVLAAGDVEGRHWEAAIDCFHSGLAVQGTEDEELTAALQEALACAEKGKTARDGARAAAAQRHAEGEAQYTARDYPASISSFQAALALDTQSEGLAAHVGASLVASQKALSDQDSARAVASALVERAENALVTSQYTVAIEAYEAASRLDVNDAEMTASFLVQVADIQVSLHAAREAARSQLTEGHRVLAAGDVEGRHWEAAIDCFHSGLAVQGIADEELTAALQEALACAEKGKTARDGARSAAAQRHAEGEAQYTARDYPASISSFQAALALDTQSATLRMKLTQILQIAVAAHEAAVLGREGVPMSVDLLHAHAKVGRWRKGTDKETEAAYAALDQHERKLLALHRSNQADLETLRKRAADGARLSRPDPWTPAPLVVKSAHGEPLDFVPRMKFCGGVGGYIFKRGGQGCGYYRSGSAACAAPSIYPLQKRLPFTAPENPHHAVQVLHKRRPDVMTPDGVPRPEQETYVKVLAQEVPVLPNGHVLLRGQIVSVSEVRRRRQDGELDAALTEWGWVSMRCPHTNRAWLQELPNTEGDLHSEEMDLKGTAVTSAAAKAAVHQAGLLEREHRGLAWQWEKSIANRPRLELPMKEHDKWMGDRKDASNRRLAARLAMRRRALGLDPSDSDAEDSASRRHPRWHEWRGVQHVEEHKEYHGPWQELAAAGGSSALSLTAAIESSRPVNPGSDIGRFATKAAGKIEIAQLPSTSVDRPQESARKQPATVQGIARRSTSNNSNNSYSYSKDLHRARAESALVLAAASQWDLDPNLKDESRMQAHGRLEDSFDLSMSSAGGKLTLHSDSEANPHSSLNHDALVLQIMLDRASASGPEEFLGNPGDRTYEEIVAADASILPYENLRKLDSNKRLERAWARMNTEKELAQLGMAQEAVAQATDRHRSLVGSRASSRIAMCRAEQRYRTGSIPLLSATAVQQRTGLGAAARYKQLREEGSFA